MESPLPTPGRVAGIMARNPINYMRCPWRADGLAVHVVAADPLSVMAPGV
ncbi:MAG: hypothetical protein KKF12_11750 [Proteobacteria bacterium]|nr:hypothetical protein [Pseudomonadota bacterium]MBU4131485.1 hypothetical protein [Pseudomonadota bacterium]